MCVVVIWLDEKMEIEYVNDKLNWLNLWRYNVFQVIKFSPIRFVFKLQILFLCIPD